MSLGLPSQALVVVTETALRKGGFEVAVLKVVNYGDGRALVQNRILEELRGVLVLVHAEKFQGSYCLFNGQQRLRKREAGSRLVVNQRDQFRRAEFRIQ